MTLTDYLRYWLERNVTIFYGTDTKRPVRMTSRPHAFSVKLIVNGDRGLLHGEQCVTKW